MMAREQKTHDLTNPTYCIKEARKLLIPVDSENWPQIQDDAHSLNILQAAIAHLVYLDTEQTDFQQQVMEIVFTAYLMGQTAEERRTGPSLEAFLEAIEGLDFTGLG
jgi:hypothetical protein